MHVVNNSSTEQSGIEENSSEVNVDFDFKYISRSDFCSIYKRVQRRRRDDIEKTKWELFLAKKVVEEKKRSTSVKQMSQNIPPDNCAACLQTMCCNVEASNPEKLRYSPFIYSHFSVDPLESSPREFSLPPSGSRNAVVHNDETEKWKMMYPRSSYPIKQTLNKCDTQTEPVSFPNDAGSGSPQESDHLALEFDLKKIQAFRSKMKLSLQNIRKLIVQGPILSDKEDFDRIKQRSSEFSARFKRNYLYRVQCNVNEIDKVLKDKQKLASKDILTQKIVLGHQACMQTLQIIEKHLPTITVESPFNLFNEFFICICDLTEKFKLVFGISAENVIDDIVDLSENIMDSMIDLVKVKPRKQKNKVEKKKLKNDLWMYSTSKKSWLNKATSLAKSKFGQKNEIVNNNKVVTNNNTSAFDTLQCLAANKSSKLNVRKRDAVAEDEIKTMVEMTELNESDNSEVNDDLQIDVESTFDQAISIDKQVIEGQTDEIRPPTLPPIMEPTPAKPTPTQLNQSSDVKVSSNNPENTITTQNVALICLTSDKPEEINRPINDEDRYRKQFRKYKEKSQFYNTRILGIVTKLSDTLLQQTINSLLKEMDVNEILGDSNTEELSIRET